MIKTWKFLFQSVDIDLETPHLALFSTPAYLALIAATVILLMMLLITVVWHVRSKNSKKSKASGYMRGRKQIRNGKGPPDLWINHHSGGHQMHEPGTFCNFFKIYANLCVILSTKLNSV